MRKIPLIFSSFNEGFNFFEVFLFSAHLKSPFMRAGAFLVAFFLKKEKGSRDEESQTTFPKYIFMILRYH